MMTWALVPVKEFSLAKSRLGQVLSPAECATLANNMARDVLMALTHARRVHHIALMGEAPMIDPLAAEFDCDTIAEDHGRDFNGKLIVAANIIETKGADSLLVLPGDLPTLNAGDIDELLERHETGVSICPATRDGGTNALVLTPPTTIKFDFGEQSAAAHGQAAIAANVPCQQIDLNAFGRDIDLPDDLIWLCGQHAVGHTGRYLDSSGIRQRLLESRMAATA
jgi:2-phospho-L-lactate guanylyltransferase